MDSSPNPTDAPHSSTQAAAHLAVYERLEKRYPCLYARLMAMDSQKHAARAASELEIKEKNERELEEAEKALEAANEGVYKALAEVDRIREIRDEARKKDRQAVFKYLPY